MAGRAEPRACSVIVPGDGLLRNREFGHCPTGIGLGPIGSSQAGKVGAANWHPALGEAPGGMGAHGYPVAGGDHPRGKVRHPAQLNLLVQLYRECVAHGRLHAGRQQCSS
jgi:hypothetical protein